MKVLICKFYNDDIERKIGELVSAEKKRAGGSLRVFCVDEPTQKKLVSAGISCETYHEFAGFGPEWEAVWDTLYEISDELRSSAENNPSLKYAGINFLSLESNTAYYVYAIRLTNLFRRMHDEKCGTLLVVVPRGYSVWVRDINSANIKTLKSGRAALSSLSAFYRHLSYQLRTALTGVSAGLRALLKKTPAAAATSDNAFISERTHQKALFVVRTALYTRPALVISGECSKSGLAPYAATDDRSLAPQWRNRGVPCSVKQLFLVSLFGAFSALVKMLLLYFRLKKHVNSFYTSGRYAAVIDEFSAVSMCRQALLGGLLPLCYEAVTDIVFLKKTLNAVKPDILCLMPQDHLLQQIALALAKERGLPALACSAAWETSASGWRGHMRADKLAASGEAARDSYITSGVQPEKVVATGIAHFDLLFTRNSEADKGVLADSGIDLRKKIIVFATDAYPVPETERMLTGVISAVAKMKDAQLVVKVHPREEAAPYQALAARYPDVEALVFKDFDLYALLHNCDLLITKGSTVALEAMIIDKPVVIINCSGLPDFIFYVEQGAAIGAYKDEEIEPAIVKALYDEEARSRLKVMRGKFVRNWAGEPDGKASHRIVTLMKEMIGAAAR